jgi:hypothetical protein
VSALLPSLCQEIRNNNQQATFFTNKNEFTSYLSLLPPDEVAKPQTIWESSTSFKKENEVGHAFKKTKFNETAPPPNPPPKYLVSPPEEKVQLKKKEPIKDTSYINYGDREEEEVVEEVSSTPQTPFITAKQKLVFFRQYLLE